MTQESIIIAFAGVHDLPPADCLSQSEIHRADQFKAPQRRKQFLCARALLRTVLQRYTGKPAASHKLTEDNNGKPLCIDGPAVSIAHSGDMIVCAATANGEIGVDIEVPGRPRDVEGIAENYFADDETAWLTTQPAERFYMLWVLKEAWLKARGAGLAGGLDTLRCIVTPPHIEARITEGELEALSLYAIADALVGLATTTVPHEAVVVDRWDPLAARFDAHSESRLIATTDDVVSLDSTETDSPTRPVVPHHPLA
jgi:phosphopantetheinyl transferase